MFFLLRAMAMGIVASEDALKDANWIPKAPTDLARTGVAIGNAMVDLDYIAESHNLLTGTDKGNKVNPFFVPKILPNLCSGHVSIMHGLKGNRNYIVMFKVLLKPNPTGRGVLKCFPFSHSDTARLNHFHVFV